MLLVDSFGQSQKRNPRHERVTAERMDADLTSGAGGTGGCWKVVVVRTASSVVGAVWNEKSGYDCLCSSLPPCSAPGGVSQLNCCEANAFVVGDGKN